MFASVMRMLGGVVALFFMCGLLHGESLSPKDAGGKAQPRFTVRGTVRDSAGNPVAGATVRANCGWGTLLPTGTTTTAANGSYTLDFSPGMVRLQGENRTIGLQAATIIAGKAGYYEVNLGRQGDLGMASEMPSAAERNANGSRFVRVVLEGKPYDLDFIMAPAAAIEGVVKDDAGRVLSKRDMQGFHFSLGSEKLPPSSSVLLNFNAENDGTFELESLPLQPVWFEFSNKQGKTARSASLDLTDATTYTLELTLHDGTFSEPTVEYKLLSKPKKSTPH